MLFSLLKKKKKSCEKYGSTRPDPQPDPTRPFCHVQVLMFIGGREGKKGIRHSSRGGHIYPLSKSSSLKPDRALFLLPVYCRRFLLLLVSYSTFHILLPKQRYFFVMLFLYQVFCLSLILLLTFLCFASSVHCVKYFRFRNFSPFCYFSFSFQYIRKKKGS